MKKLLVGSLICLGLAGLACRREGPKPTPTPPPRLSIILNVVTADGDPLQGAAIEAVGAAQGETDSAGKLIFQVAKDPGDEFTVTAKLDRPGLKFKPWQETVVVKKWDATKPETMQYNLQATLEPEALAAKVVVQTDAGPAPGAPLVVDGKPVKTDAAGEAWVDLKQRMTRSATLAVTFKDHQPFSQKVDLRAGETFTVALAKIGVVYSKVIAGYERMGRFVPVADAEVTIGGKAIGKTDVAGSLRYAAPAKPATAEVAKEGFVGLPQGTQVPARRAMQLYVPLVPREAPVFRLFMQKAQNLNAGDAEIEGVLGEVQERLSDQLFSYGCFVAADSEKNAELVIATNVSRAPAGLLLSIRLLAGGKQLAGFAETGRFNRVRSLCEDVTSKVLDSFPFEGHVVGIEGQRVVASLGSAKGRKVSKGDTMILYKWTAAAAPTLTRTTKGTVRRASADSSQLELEGGVAKAQVGDKVVLVPREREAAFGSAVTVTVKAGIAGSEQPFADVSVYRDGVWVGTTSSEGALKVPVAPGEKHVLLFVKGGIKPYMEEVKVGGSPEEKTILMPEAVAHVRIESEPSGARVTIDDADFGVTPLEANVVMGFHRVKVDASGDWRAYDEVLELRSVEENLTGARRIVLQKDTLRQAEMMVAKGDVDGAIAALSAVERRHPDYSAAHHRVAGLYLDRKGNPAKAIEEYEKVLALPENRELVNKRFAITFLNLGRAYYQLGTPQGYEKAISRLLTARANKRFFPKDAADRATHDTHYFLALATHKLYHAQQTPRLLRETAARWKDYFDFFPESLAGEQEVQQARKGAEDYYEEIKRKLTD
jgi:hypothetical protein